MPTPYDALYDRLASWAESHGIRTGREPMDAETPGRFDGPTVTMNADYDPAERCWYFAHALGSVVRWSLDPEHCRRVFEELDAAKAAKRDDPERLERALRDYRVYESDASEYAVWLLGEQGFAEHIPAYTNFARADLDAMTVHHREGTMPVWRDFFAAWNRDVAAGRRQVEPFRARPVPPFRPVRMREQEIVQEVDGQP